MTLDEARPRLTEALVGEVAWQVLLGHGTFVTIDAGSNDIGTGMAQGLEPLTERTVVAVDLPTDSRD